MLRTIFAIACAGLIFAATSGSAGAAPIAPLPAATTASFDNLTEVHWGRRCWRDRWGQLVCTRGGRGVGWDGCWHDAWGRPVCNHGGPGFDLGWGCWTDAWGRVICRR
jgi:hypothetical protein